MGQVVCKELWDTLFDYKTEKYVVTHNRKVGLFHRLVQLSIIMYLLIWVFLIKKGYQDIDTSVQSSIITKVKGVAFTNTSELGARIWDVADFVIPPQGENTFFIVTNLVVTPDQRRATCAENDRIPQARCYEDTDCPPGEPILTGNGVRTGRCLRSGSSMKGTCEIIAWCPVETKCRPEMLTLRVTPTGIHEVFLVKDPGALVNWKPLLGTAENFTVYIKNFIHFPKFNFSKSNVLSTSDKRFLKSCQYGPDNHYCPIFRLGYIVNLTGSSFQELAKQGGVIGIQITWDCDLDKAASKCHPHYNFRRLDYIFSENDISAGYNFRFARYYHDAAGVEFRTLIKAYGIRFVVMVNGKAGKFGIIPTGINVASGLALMGIASFLCDLILVNCIKQSDFYRNTKYEEVRWTRSLPGLAVETSDSAEQPATQDGGSDEKNGYESSKPSSFFSTASSGPKKTLSSG